MTMDGDTPDHVLLIEGEGGSVLDELADELDDLLHAASVPVTATRPWLACWARHHTDWQPWTVGIRRGGRLCGVAVFARQVRRGIAHITMLGHPESDYTSLPVRTEADAVPLAVAIDKALRRQRRPWTMHLEQLPVGDPVVAALRARLHNCELGAGDPCVITSITPGIDPRSAISKRVRKNTNNARNRLSRDGFELTTHSLRDGAAVRASLPEITRVRSAGNIAKGLDDHASAAKRGFWTDILPLLADRGELEITEVRLDGRLACYAVCLVDGTAYRGWDTRLDPEFARYSPGHLLREAVLERLATGGSWTEYDLMRGTEDYKNATQTYLRDLVEVRAWSSPLLRAPRRARRGAAAVRDRYPALARLDAATRKALLNRDGPPSSTAAAEEGKTDS